MPRVAGAYVEIEADLSELTKKVHAALSDVSSKFGTVEKGPQVGGDFSKLTNAAKAAAADAAGKLRGIPDADVDGDFSGVESGASSAVSGVKQKLGSLKGWAKGGLAAAGAAGGAALVAGLTNAISTETARDKLSAQLGLTGKDSERAGKIAGELYRGAYGESLGEVGDTIAQVSQNIRSLGKTSNSEIKSSAAYALDIAQTFGSDTQEITRAVGGLIRNGMAKDTSEAFDLLTRGFQLGADKGGEFLDTLNEYAEPVKSLGLNARDFTNILVQGSNKGVYSVDKIGDALKEFSIRVTDGSTLTKTAFQQIGLNADQMGEKFAQGGPQAKVAMEQTLDALRSIHDPLIREQAGVGLFGSMWEDIGGKAILGLDPTKNALGETNDAAKDLDQTIGGNLSTKLESLKRTVLGGISDVLIKTVIPAVSAFVDKIKLDPNTAKGLEDVKRTLTDLGTVLSSGPVKAALGILGGAISRFIAGTVQVFQNLAQVVRGVVQVIAGILTLNFGKAIDGVKNIFGGLAGIIWGALRAVTAPARELAAKLGGGIFNAIKGFISGIPGMIGNFLGFAKDKIVAYYTGFLGAAKNLGQKVIDGVVSLIKNLPGKVWDWLVNASAKINAFETKAFNAAKGVGSSMVDGLISVFKAVPGRVWDAISGFVSDIVSFVKDKLGIKSPSTVFEEIGQNMMAGLFNGLGSGDVVGFVNKQLGGFGTLAKELLEQSPGLLGIEVKVADKMLSLGGKLFGGYDPNDPFNVFFEGWHQLFERAWGLIQKAADGAKKVRGLAGGGTNIAGGLYRVGERGEELVQLPTGSNVYSAPATRRMLSAPPIAGGKTVHEWHAINPVSVDDPTGFLEQANGRLAALGG